MYVARTRPLLQAVTRIRLTVHPDIFRERTGSRWHRLLIRSGCVATSSTLAVHDPAPSRARIQSIYHIDPQRQTTATIPQTTAVHTVATASRRCFHALSAEPVNAKSPSGADPSEAAADAQPAGQSDIGPRLKWVARTGRGTEAECIGLRPIDARLDHMPTTCLHCGGRRGWTATWHLSKSGDPHWHQRSCRRLARGSQTPHAAQ